ncbi:MAG: hypothetical protein AABZ02_10245 [Bacteroidota bacterium]
MSLVAGGGPHRNGEGNEVLALGYPIRYASTMPETHLLPPWALAVLREHVHVKTARGMVRKRVDEDIVVELFPHHPLGVEEALSLSFVVAPEGTYPASGCHRV